MSVSIIAAGAAVLLAAAIIVVGARYLVAPTATASTFGLRDWPQDGADAWLHIKGVRDIASGLIGLVLLVVAPLPVLGWYLVTAAVIPLGDAAIVFKHHGSKGLAYGMHGGTAAAMVLVGVLLLLG